MNIVVLIEYIWKRFILLNFIATFRTLIIFAGDRKFMGSP